MIPSSTKKKTGVVRLPTIKPHPFVRDFHFEFPSSWHCTPSCLVSRQSGAVFHPGPSPVVSAKAGLPLNLSLNPRNCLCSKRFLRHRSLGYLFWTDFSAATT